MSSQAKSPTELGTANIGRLLISYALPAIAAQMAASIYNVVDSIFIGRGVEPMALAGLGITLPLMNMAAAFGALVGAGGAALLSIKLGQKDHRAASLVLGNVVILNVIIGLAVMLFGLIFMNKILYLFGASDESLPYAKDFMQVILIGNVITHMYFGLSCLVRSCGFPKKAMMITMMSVAVNVVLAPLFIFVFHWGIAGAAWATVISQASALGVLLLHFADKKKFIHFEREIFHIDWGIIKGIISIGMSPFMMNICACLIVIVINNQLYAHGGDYAIGAYGIVNKVLMLFVMLVLGLNQGMQPIAGYNYGAQQYDRVKDVLKKTILYATAVMCLAFAVCQLFPQVICSIFTDDEDMTRISASAMRIMVATFPIIGFQMVTSNFFQSIGKAGIAVILSTSRQLLFLLPSLFILPRFFGLTGVWMSIPTSDIFSTIVTACFLVHEYRRIGKER